MYEVQIIDTQAGKEHRHEFENKERAVQQFKEACRTYPLGEVCLHDLEAGETLGYRAELVEYPGFK